NDTWTWDGTNWTLKNPATSPPAGDCYATFAFDETHQQAILVLQSADPNVSSSVTWSWDGSTWTQLNPVHKPVVFNEGEQLVFDRARGELLLIAHTDNNSNFVSTWSWSGTDWIRKPPAGDLLPYDLNPGQMVYDGAHQLVLIFDQHQRMYAWN